MDGAAQGMSGTFDLWFLMIALGLGSFAIRFVFLGMVGDKPLPDWLLRLLRYTPVAILPALVAPLVVWPSATGGSPSLAHGLAALATLALGYATKNVALAIAGGAVTLYAVIMLI